MRLYRHALQSLAWTRPLDHMRTNIDSALRFHDGNKVVGAIRVCAEVVISSGARQARKRFRKLVGPFRAQPRTSTLAFQPSVNSLELLACATSMISATRGFAKSAIGRRLTIPAARRNMYTTSAPRVAVLYQELDPPLINGVRKPKKPRGAQPSFFHHPLHNKINITTKATSTPAQTSPTH